MDPQIINRVSTKDETSETIVQNLLINIYIS